MLTMRWLLVALATVLLMGATLRDDAAARHERGRAVYNFRCYFCHGYSGDAKTVAAGYVDPPPRDFTAIPPGGLTVESVIATLHAGRKGTAMKSFEGILDANDRRAVATFVVEEFVQNKRVNTRYHTAANGWPDHERHRDAFPFATGQIAQDAPWESLDAAQTRGKKLFLSACVSCHDRATPEPTRNLVAWDARPVSYPPDGHDCTSCHDRSRYDDRGPPASHRPVSYHRRDVGEAVAPSGDPRKGGAGPYSQHDEPRRIANLTPLEQRGERTYLANCSFCHAADGTGRNWIGRFLEPHPRDLTDPEAMRHMTPARLAQRIRDGLPNTSMPAWRHILSEEEIAAVVAYVGRAFHPLAEDTKTAVAPAR